MGAKQQLLFDIFVKKVKLSANHEYFFGSVEICEVIDALDK